MLRVVPSVVGLIPMLQIVFQFVCIKLHGKIAMPGFLIFPLILLDAVVTNAFVFTLASRVNSTSTEVLEMQVRHSVQLGAKRSVLERSRPAASSI